MKAAFTVRLAAGAFFAATVLAGAAAFLAGAAATLAGSTALTGALAATFWLARRLLQALPFSPVRLW
jgi:glucose-6-phosphate-specific signal transduction histidine kinase